jgi:hypothetical protein
MAPPHPSVDSLTSLLKTMGGDDCDRPACDDTKSALSAAMRRVDRRRGGGGGDIGDASSGTSVTDAPNCYAGCPPTRDEIGASAWLFLHSMVGFFLPKRENSDGGAFWFYLPPAFYRISPVLGLESMI